MTIDSVYQPEEFVVTGPQVYDFVFENDGSSSVYVYEKTIGGTEIFVSPSNYSLVVNGSGPIHDGGTVTFLVAHGADVSHVVIKRETEMLQVIDFEDGKPFPADVVEYALDKLTMMRQEELVGGGQSGSFVDRSGDTMFGPLAMISGADLTINDPNNTSTGWGSQLYATGGAGFSDNISIFNYEGDNSAGMAFYATTNVTGPDAVLILTPSVNDPFSDPYSPDQIHSLTEFWVRTYEDLPGGVPGTVHEWQFTREGQLRAPESAPGVPVLPVYPNSLVTKKWVEDNAGAGGSGVYDHTVTVSQVANPVPPDELNNGWRFGSYGNLVGMNRGIIDYTSTDIDAQLQIITNDWRDPGTGFENFPHTFLFSHEGTLTVPGDFIMDSDATNVDDPNTGAFEMRNYEPNLGGDATWFSLYATNNVAGGDDGKMLLVPAQSLSSGTPQWYRNSLSIMTYGFNGPHTFDQQYLNEWEFKTNGDFVACGDVIIDSSNNNKGALEIRNIDAAGPNDRWWSMYVQNATDAGGQFGVLNIQPAHEDLGGSPTWTRGEIHIYTKPTNGAAADWNKFTFDMDGNIYVPRSIILDQNGGSNGGLYIKNFEGAGDYYWGLYVASGGQAVLTPGWDGTFYDGEFEIQCLDIGEDLRGYKFTDDGKIQFKNDGTVRGHVWLEDIGGVFYNMEMWAAADARVKGGTAVRLQLDGGEYLNLTPTEVVSNKNIRTSFRMKAGLQPLVAEDLTRKDYVDTGDASDIRLKDITGELRFGLDEIMALNTIEFDYRPEVVWAKRAKDHHYGLIAQEVKEILPHIVHGMPGQGDYLAVDYVEIVPVLINAVQELADKIKKLEEK